MAISVIDSDAADINSSATITLNFTAIEDDLVVVFGAGTGSTTITTSGYTTTDFIAPPHTYAGAFGIKKMTASPDSSVAIDGTSFTGALCFVMRGQDLTTPEDAALVFADALAAAPDSGSITTATAHAFVLSCWFGTGANTTAPSGYSDTVFSTPANFIAGAWKDVAAAGAENPGVWSGGIAGNYTALTWALRPAVVAGQPTSKRMGGVRYAAHNGVLIPSRSIW